MSKLFSGKADNVYLVAYDYHTGDSADDIKAKIVELNTNDFYGAESSDFMIQESLYFIKSNKTISAIRKEFSFVDENNDFVIFKLGYSIADNIVYSKENKNRILPILRD